MYRVLEMPVVVVLATLAALVVMVAPSAPSSNSLPTTRVDVPSLFGLGELLDVFGVVRKGDGAASAAGADVAGVAPSFRIGEGTLSTILNRGVANIRVGDWSGGASDNSRIVPLLLFILAGVTKALLFLFAGEGAG